MERKRIIAITPEENRYIQKVFRVSGVTVWQAVRYVKNGDLHKKIRKFAIERGNPVMVVAPEADTIFIENREDADKGMMQYMVQTFGNGATMEGNRSTGMITIRNKRGEIAYAYDNPKVNELKAIQELAMKL